MLLGFFGMKHNTQRYAYLQLYRNGGQKHHTQIKT
jgi:hypothetical protein